MKSGSGPSSHCRFQNCKNNSSMKGKQFYRFPKEEKRCQAWVKACQNRKLEGISASKLHASSRVCSDHFQDWCFMNLVKKHRLVHNAVPDSPKPGEKHSNDIYNAVSSDNASTSSVPYQKIDNLSTALSLGISATSELNRTVLPKNDNISTTVPLENAFNSSYSPCEPNSTVLSKIDNISQSDETSALKQLLLSPIPCSTVRSSHISQNSFNLGASFSNASKVQCTDNSNSLDIASDCMPLPSIGCSTPISHSRRKYTPKELRLVKELKKQKDFTRRLSTKYNKIKKQLEKSRNLPLNMKLMSQGVQEKLANFIHRQVKLSEQKSKRFTTYEKINAYNIFSKSKDAYHALRELLNFPSERTLQRFIASKLL